MAYKQHRDQVKLEEAAAFLKRLEEGFQKSCEEAGAIWHPHGPDLGDERPFGRRHGDRRHHRAA
jgi:hypothetical protein